MSAETRILLKTLARCLAMACAVQLAACHECEYQQRCQGDVLQVCIPAAHGVGSASDSYQPCDGPNPYCVETGDDTAGCFHSRQECEVDASTDSCDGDVALRCDEGGHEFAEDCAASGNLCASNTPTGARCVFESFTECDEETPRRCEGDLLVRCVDGALEAMDCAAMGQSCQMGEVLVLCLPN